MPMPDFGAFFGYYIDFIILIYNRVKKLIRQL